MASLGLRHWPKGLDAYLMTCLCSSRRCPWLHSWPSPCTTPILLLSPIGTTVTTTRTDSPCFKHKKHWNNFTTAFFIPLDELERQMRGGGRVALVSPERERELEGAALRCHACGRAAKTMPELKAHACRGAGAAGDSGTWRHNVRQDGL